MNKQELLNDIRAGHSKLEAALASLTEAQMIEAGLPNSWSIKDLLGHFAFWEKRATTLYYNLASGTPVEDISGQLDAINARVYAENQARSLAEVRRLEAEAYRDMLKMVEDAPDDDLFNPARFPGTGGNAFAGTIEGDSSDHYAEHWGELAPLLKRLGVDQA